MYDRREATRGLGAVEEPDQREDMTGCRVKQSAVQQLNASEQVGCFVGLNAAARVSPDIEEVIAASFIADRGCCRLQQQDGVHGFGIKGASEAEQGGPSAIEPEHITIDHEKCLAE